MPISQLATSVFLQLAAIIAMARGVGWLTQRLLGQPQVVGEMIAGIVLGPSLLGALAPHLSSILFPLAARGVLYAGAQLGVGLYMFLVGLTFDKREFKASARSAAAVAIGSMAAPFLAGLALAGWLTRQPGLFMPGVSTGQAGFFLGAAIAITAFPMLARIIHERGIAGTRLGTISLAAGAIGDAGAWVVVALVLASLGAGQGVAIRALGGGLGFAVLMLGLAPRLLAPLGRRAETRGVDESLTAICLVLFLLSAWIMDAAGMHAVFGGFLLGTALPRGRLCEALRARLEPFTTTFLLPMFFTFTGLNTDLRLLTTASLIGATLAVLMAAILAKGGACYLAARLSGEDHHTALGLGALMNARGLMELIIIGIGMQHHIIGPSLFAMLVLMAIVTTLMASPLFTLSQGKG